MWLRLTPREPISSHVPRLGTNPRRREETVERHSAHVPHGKLLDLPQDVLLTADQVANWLQVARRQVLRLGIPCIDLGWKTPRYQVKDVLAWLETRRRDTGWRRASSS